MKRILLAITFTLIVKCAYALNPDSVYLGNNAAPRNVTVSSTTTTPLITSDEAKNMGGFILVNHGAFDVYITTFSGAVTTGSNNTKIEAGENIAIAGQIVGIPWYCVTTSGPSQTCRMEVWLFREIR